MKRRKRIGGAVRLLGSVVMLAVLVPRASRLVSPVLRPSTMAWLVAALCVTLVGVVLSALRWQLVLTALGIPSRIRALLAHCLAGLFVSNFLPSTIGGDVLRVARLSATNGERPRSFASVVLERLTGWLVLPVMSLATLVVNPGLLRPPILTASRLVVFISLITLSLLGVLLFAASSPWLGTWLAARDGWVRFVNAVHFGLTRFRRDPAAAAEVLLIGFLYQFAVVLAAFLAAKALGLGLSWTAVLAFMPAVAIVQVLPAPTIGGLGVREGAFVLFLHPLGVSTDQAIALGLLLYGINLVTSLLGAPAFAVGSTKSATAAV